MKWFEVYKNKSIILELLISIVILVITLSFYTNFLNYIEARTGVILPDPILALFNPIDFTWLTFGIIYISLFVAIISLIQYPKQLTFAIQVYFVMILFRIAAMYSLPLEPPALMIALNDPLVEIAGTGKLLTKDLFFSGHTATLFLLFLVSKRKTFKYLFLICTVLVAICVLLQHVHYTIDVLAAPFFSYASYRIMLLFRNKFFID